MGGVAGSGCYGIVYKKWGVEWYHPCRCSITASGLVPPTRLTHNLMSDDEFAKKKVVTRELDGHGKAERKLQKGIRILKFAKFN